MQAYFAHELFSKKYQMVQPKSYISFKLDPSSDFRFTAAHVPNMKYSFTHHVSKACIYAAAKVARGGLRWSDRREDFRTEVLGLMKAQQVKNTVIVPEGAKGGFVVEDCG